jgi:phage baseplate assembly protein W
MAIKIKSLENISKNYIDTNYIYKDLSLDMSQATLKVPGTFNPVSTTEIHADYDIEAIKNSIHNLFSTTPGQRFLFPEYGCDLRRFLFAPITDANANALGNFIFAAIGKNEPRLIVKKVEIGTDPDNNEYLINIKVEIPALQIPATISATLNTDRQSFNILPSSQRR